jgi:hypothetical protein
MAGAREPRRSAVNSNQSEAGSIRTIVFLPSKCTWWRSYSAILASPHRKLFIEASTSSDTKLAEFFLEKLMD